ncbi:putative translation initiation factor SUI1 [Toxoplasma gondii VAND]|uniref:Putative translation initiation factor SUI1 n=1 Tax=Toxoplasma gondii VAND TaxID=933077 RepID=A0A086QHB3_TOXGO|nr:putative translation initiation factor SUI1 [Toxoplasma gondii VAND]
MIEAHPRSRRSPGEKTFRPCFEEWNGVWTTPMFRISALSIRLIGFAFPSQQLEPEAEVTFDAHLANWLVTSFRTRLARNRETRSLPLVKATATRDKSGAIILLATRSAFWPSTAHVFVAAQRVAKAFVSVCRSDSWTSFAASVFSVSSRDCLERFYLLLTATKNESRFSKEAAIFFSTPKNNLELSARVSHKFSSDFLMSVEVHNFGISDPFANDTSQFSVGGSSTHLIHIRNQQRNGRKSVTTVQGLDKALDLKKMVRALKKELNCNGTVIEDADYGSVIQLQGDQRHAVKEFLEREAICLGEQIRIHGA